MPSASGLCSQTAPLFQVAGDLVRRLHLEAHVDKPVATYSGGTKRKLSAALALLGGPDLLLLVSSELWGTLCLQTRCANPSVFLPGRTFSL